MNEIVTSLNANSGYSVSGIEYPNIEVLNISDALAVLMTCLKPGNIPIYIHHGDNVHKLRVGVDPNPMNIASLLRVYPIKINLAQGNSVNVRNTEELLNLGKWW